MSPDKTIAQRSKFVTPERPVMKYFGAKWSLAPWIIGHFPAHRIYVEPFGGGASVLMRKPRAYSEVYNDLDGEIVNVFRILRSDFDALASALRATPYSRDEYDLAWTPATDPVEMARRTLVRSHMGMGDATTGQSKTGFRARSEHSGTSKSENWRTWLDALDSFHDRLMGVVIENRDAKEVMLQQDGEATLHFVDPPYVHASRSASANYRFEMTDEQHAELCAFLASLKGMVILCGYENPIYDRLGWATVTREAYADGAMSGKKDRVEVLWLNPAAEKAQSQGKLL